ncbi:MAG TPA: four-carbon acid sugar kinase family protein [Bryobacteraceae bacterium]
MQTSLSCVLIADDLTGACDSAVHFKLRGIQSAVHLDLDAHQQSTASVHAFNTETRDADAPEMEQRIRRVADITSTAKPGIIFKKIDSLLRGNPGREVMVALEAFGCDLAIVTPAFPEMGRTVRNGHLEVHGDSTWARLDVAALLRGQGLEHCTHIAPGTVAAAIERGARAISLDITAHEDLERLVTEALATGKNILWAGSGGLASALAGALFSDNIKRELHSPGTLPVVFCIGSDHPVTAGQIFALRRERATSEIHADSNVTASLVNALEKDQHVIFRIPRGQVPNEQLLILLRNIVGRAGAMVLSGGDTAATVCRAVAAREIEVADQVVAGLPWGTLRGGLLDGFPVATKSGAFGRDADLIKVADFFTCPKT